MWLTLYPEDLMCTPLFVSVDFILMKKDRSRVLSGARRLGLVDSTEKPEHTDTCKLSHGFYSSRMCRDTKLRQKHGRMLTDFIDLKNKWIKTLRKHCLTSYKHTIFTRQPSAMILFCVKTNKYIHSLSRSHQPITAALKLSIKSKQLERSNCQVSKCVRSQS